MTVALIATVKDEASSIYDFLESIGKQTRMPDLVVIVDGGSTDGTWGELQAWSWDDHASLNAFITQKLGNRSVGRNEAIRIAAERGAEIIACCNVGVLDPYWFDQIIGPIEYGDVDVVGGSYRIVTKNAREAAAAAVTQYTPEEILKKKFVTALSMAFTVEVWENVGRFPEELDTSEDTVFVQKLRDAACEFAYVPEAIVNWRPSTLTLRGAYRTYKQFAKTDWKAWRAWTKQKVGTEPKYGHYLATAMVYMGLVFGITLLLVPLLTPSTLTDLGWSIMVGGLGIFWFWLNYRTRKVKGLRMWPYGMAIAIAVDIARIRGFFA